VTVVYFCTNGRGFQLPQAHSQVIPQHGPGCGDHKRPFGIKGMQKLPSGSCHGPHVSGPRVTSRRTARPVEHAGVDAPVSSRNWQLFRTAARSVSRRGCHIGLEIPIICQGGSRVRTDRSAIASFCPRPSDARSRIDSRPRRAETALPPGCFRVTGRALRCSRASHRIAPSRFVNLAGWTAEAAWPAERAAEIYYPLSAGGHEYS